MNAAKKIIKKLGLQPHPEGGYFKETYRNSLRTDDKNLCTAIYYMITSDTFSSLHRVSSDEIFHFYCGDSIEMIQINDAGMINKIELGSDIVNGQEVQVLIPKGIWQGSKLKQKGKWALIGATVSPGFDYNDFELADRKKLISMYPHLEREIVRYTRD